MKALEKYLAEVKARTEAATPGEWRAELASVMSESRVVVAICAQENSIQDWPTQARPGGNARFIAHACTDIEIMLNIISEAMGALAGLRIFAEDLCEDIGVSKHYNSLEKARDAMTRVEALVKARSLSEANIDALVASNQGGEK